METRTAPTFATVIRGYDREEVDSYVDSLAKALEDLEESEEHSRRLQSHLTRLNARVKELEDRIKTETPHTAGALGERITLLLEQAEAGAEEAVSKARAEADEILRKANAEAAAVQGKADAAMAEADAHARRVIDQAEAEVKASEQKAQHKAQAIIADAERRATARTRQVEEWEEQVVAHTQAEQARQARRHEDEEAAHRQRLAEIDIERDRALASLRTVREGLLALMEASDRDRGPRSMPAVAAAAAAAARVVAPAAPAAPVADVEAERPAAEVADRAEGPAAAEVADVADVAGTAAELGAPPVLTDETVADLNVADVHAPTSTPTAEDDAPAESETTAGERDEVADDDADVTAGLMQVSTSPKPVLFDGEADFDDDDPTSEVEVIN